MPTGRIQASALSSGTTGEAATRKRSLFHPSPPVNPPISPFPSELTQLPFAVWTPPHGCRSTWIQAICQAWNAIGACNSICMGMKKIDSQENPGCLSSMTPRNTKAAGGVLLMEKEHDQQYTRFLFRESVTYQNGSNKIVMC